MPTNLRMQGRGLSPPGRGEAEPLLKGEREGVSPSLLQAFYNQWLAEIPRDLVKNP